MLSLPKAQAAAGAEWGPSVEVAAAARRTPTRAQAPADAAGLALPQRGEPIVLGEYAHTMPVPVAAFREHRDRSRRWTTKDDARIALGLLYQHEGLRATDLAADASSHMRTFASRPRSHMRLWMPSPSADARTAA